MKINSFNPVARAYSKSVAPYRFSQFLTLVYELKFRGSEKVLDIGTGPGELSMQIAAQLTNGGYLKGIDLSGNMVRLARKTAASHKQSNVHFETGDALNLNFDDDTFDVVVSSNAFPWVPDRIKFLHEVYRVLKPGGQFGLVALSNNCYKEFGSAFKKAAINSPHLFPQGKPFEIMGAKLHSLIELSKLVSRTGFTVTKDFQLSTEEPIQAVDYINRVNAIVNENYLDHLGSNGKRLKARKLIVDALRGRNGSLKVTESSIFIIAQKPAA